MTLFLLIAAIAIVGYFVFKIYSHDNTAFYKLTGYSYFDVLAKKNIRTSYKLMHELEQVKDARKILLDLQIPVYEELQTIDALLLHESGIYVVNVKDKSGWINGREQSIEWKELLHKNKTRVFNNPIHETKRLINALQDQLPEVDGTLFETVVVFTNDCSFQQIEIQSENVEVLKMSELKEWAKSRNGKRLSETDIDTLYTVLEGFMNVKNTTLQSKTLVSTN
ncbi:nuclease-related domain-containing protein [Solibacillus silvestris]|uniref:nuclease-related domain-containing protein n=1 Tax=Solibacillus silvestris TaxID=76853 RepID=UPI003F7E054B